MSFDYGILIFIYVSLAAFASYSLKKQTNFSVPECIILGLTSAIPAVFCVIVDVLQLVAVGFLKVGFIMGGKEYTEVIQSFISKQIGKNVTVVEGDEPDLEE